MITKNHPHRFMSDQFLHQFFGNALVKTGDQVIGFMINEKDSFVLNGLAADGQGQVNAPVHQHLKQQVFGLVVPRFDVVHGGQQVALYGCLRGVKDLRHIETVDF